MASPIQTLDLSQARVRSSEGSGTTTLTINDFRHQIFNLSADRTLVLPTTGVKKGMKWTLDQRSTNGSALSIQSSNGSAINQTNGSNDFGIIKTGTIIMLALQDTPTTPAHWAVDYVVDSGIYSPSATGTGNVSSVTAQNSHYQRINNIVFVSANFSLTPSTINVEATFRFSLPIASNFSAGTDATGTCGLRFTAGNTSGYGRYCEADSTNDQISVAVVTPSSGGGTQVVATATYRIRS